MVRSLPVIDVPCLTGNHRQPFWHEHGYAYASVASLLQQRSAHAAHEQWNGASHEQRNVASHE